jgi:GNAT superfamily N-acetyltransferase
LSDLLRDCSDKYQVVDAYMRNTWDIWVYKRGRTEKDVKMYSGEDLRWVDSKERNNFVMGITNLTQSTVEDKIDEMLEYAKKNQKPNVLWLLDDTSKPSNLKEILAEKGFTEGQPYPIMGLELDKIQEDNPTYGELEIIPVKSVDELRTWTEILVAAWGSQYRDYFEYVFRTEDRLGYSDDLTFRKYLGYLDGAEGVAGLYEVSTHPDYSRRGIGTLMSLYALRWASREGYCVSVLNSSEVAVPVYERMGYEVYGLLQTYLWKNDAVE